MTTKTPAQGPRFLLNVSGDRLQRGDARGPVYKRNHVGGLWFPRPRQLFVPTISKGAGRSRRPLKESPSWEVSAQTGASPSSGDLKVRVTVVSAFHIERPPRTSDLLPLTAAIRCSARGTSATKSPASGRAATDRTPEPHRPKMIPCPKGFRFRKK
jgi:hypothetical protein